MRQSGRHDPLQAIHDCESLLHAVVQEDLLGDLDLNELSASEWSGLRRIDWDPDDPPSEFAPAVADLLNFLHTNAKILNELQLEGLSRWRWWVRYGRHRLKPVDEPGAFSVRARLLIPHEGQPLVKAVLLMIGKGIQPRRPSACLMDARAILDQLRAQTLSQSRGKSVAASSPTPDPHSQVMKVLGVYASGQGLDAKQVHALGKFSKGANVRSAIVALLKRGWIEEAGKSDGVKVRRISKSGAAALAKCSTTSGDNGTTTA